MAIKRFENEHTTQNADKQWKLVHPRVAETNVFWKAPESKGSQSSGDKCVLERAREQIFGPCWPVCIRNSASQHEGNHRQHANGRAWSFPGKFIYKNRPRVDLASGLHWTSGCFYDRDHWLAQRANQEPFKGLLVQGHLPRIVHVPNARNHMLLSLNRVWLVATPGSVACQALLSMEFSRQECWSGLPFPPPGIFPTQGSNPHLLPLLPWEADPLPLSHQGSPETILGSW